MSGAEVERPYITASEVGNFAYCPEAWYLQRIGRLPAAQAMRRLHAGTRAHQRIGRRTERLVALDALRRGLLLAVLVLAGLLLAASMGWPSAGHLW